MKKLILFCFIITLMSCYCVAQSSAGAIWLLISPSPSMNGMGEIGVCLPDDDPISAYFNPANGLRSYNGVSAAYSNMEANWLQNLASDIKLKHSYLGMNLIPDKYPFQIVINRQNTILDLGEQTYMDEYGNYMGTFSSQMNATAYSVATRYHDTLWKIPFDISAGFSRKNVIQDLIPDEYLDHGSGTSENIFYDAGVLASIPLTLNVKDKWNFSLSPAFGYSMSNIGDSIVFIDPAMADPSPRLARTGISLSAKISLRNGWSLFEYRGGRAASDILVLPLYSNKDPIRYQSGFGDINFYENVIQSKSDSEIEISRGHEISFLDIYSYRFGRKINVSRKRNVYEIGYGINSNGILELIHYLTKIKLFALLNRHINITYNYAKWTEAYGHPLDDTEFSSYTFSFNNIDRIVKWLIDNYGLDNPSLHHTGLTIVGGINFSTMNFNDKDIQKKAEVTFGQGYDFGIETKFKNFVTGISLSQYTADYRLEIPVAFFYMTPELTDTYHYLTFYGLIPYSVIKPLIVFSGAQVSNCIGRKVKVEDISDCIDCNEYSLNYGIIAGVDLMFNSWIGLRTSYNYWLRFIENDLIEDKKFRLSGIRFNLLIKL
ncbi:MAG: hypothetical protein ISS29_08635 [Candidatus Marinimicrobia bacterium]|nr:hypothetical protein [Candidatus Neomarinimicrobiota bacterium]